MSDTKNGGYILGLDIGVNSIGWAILKADENLNPTSIEDAGARVFEAGVEGDIESGKDESRNLKRRDARSIRKRLDRNARRLNEVFYRLQTAELLPKSNTKGNQTGEEKQRVLKAKTRHEIIISLDNELMKMWCEKLQTGGATKDDLRLFHLKFPYFLRARALDEKLEPFELGRAIYHLAQRRGFLSNRKALKKEDEKKGEVKKGIDELSQFMRDTNSRTLGEYFSKINPEDRRIRQRWTSRAMYLEEFEKIWAAQKSHHPSVLTDEFKEEIEDAIFYQRPLKIQKHLIGKCELETNPPRPRAPMAILDTQRFRMLQMVNNTRVIPEYGELRDLEPTERNALVDLLQTNGDTGFKEAKKKLGLSNKSVFNFEEGGEKRFLGNRTAAKLEEVFGEKRWKEFTEDEKNRIVEDWLSIQKEETLRRRGKEVWGLDDESAKKFGELELEQGYARFSKAAINKLLPLMEKGARTNHAIYEVYDPPIPEPDEFLPMITQKLMPELRNPTVSRSLTELRKVVNAVLREYGKPVKIRVELARDLKKSRKQRKELSDKMRQNQKAREEAAASIMKEAGITQPKSGDIQKYLLAVECNWTCPYTSKSITPKALFGDHPQFDIEHIIPFSRCLDDSFMNKTLCDHNENVHGKKQRTPFEAYSADPEKWNEILLRVQKFQGEAMRAKLRRFKLESKTEDAEKIFEDFATNQLNDTRYASKLAKKYLGLLYGEEAKSRIQIGRGATTAFLRNEWKLNKILNDGGEKKRDDHRHHAVDAVAIALTGPKTVKMLSDAAYRAVKEGRRWFANVQPPWDGFFEDACKVINSIIVSHRVSRKVNGPLHEETFYSPPKKDRDGKEYHSARKSLDALSKDDVDNIIDDTVREKVKSKLAEFGGGEPKKVFASPENHPHLDAKDGRKIPIHRVRVKKSVSPFKIGKGLTERYVTTDANHHVEIVEILDKKRNSKWEGHIVTQFEAIQRHRKGEPVIKTNHNDGKKFLFSLAGGEVIEIDEGNGKRGLYIIRTIAKMKQGKNEYVNLAFVPLNDARMKKEIIAKKEWRTSLIDPLRKLNCRKVSITPLGEVRRAND